MFLSALVALAATTMSTGCHRGPDTIDRVQPNAIKKAMLDGEWYFQTKVVDVPGGMTHGFMVPAVVGWSTDPERIAFDIQEYFLYIRRATELIDGSQSYSQDWDDDLDSHAILAAYAIESHFDIVQDYNPVTGEKFNVIVENTTDRPWWEREFIRVDWSVNLAPNYELGEGLELVDQEPIAFYVQDECTPQDETAISVEDRCIPDDTSTWCGTKKAVPFYAVTSTSPTPSSPRRGWWTPRVSGRYPPAGSSATIPTNAWPPPTTPECPSGN